ncbi:hypothetical protein C4D60_Mb09t10620 [Musa balbisiana]|uniref:Transcription factor CBF/NF-Y/archaeal histone domain-containing protein n=1 Tax=Musa balbisiana TaxID=52838 RepID=A0A4S8IFH5_MUSBA|nr:hypothetical protein C4D60_Mb09t10620 [Musa balbisiana]
MAHPLKNNPVPTGDHQQAKLLDHFFLFFHLVLPDSSDENEEKTSYLLKKVDMEVPGHGQPAGTGAVQLPYVSLPYQANQMMVTSLPPSAGQMTNPASQVQLTQHHLAYQRAQQQQMNQLHQTLQMFRTNQYQEIAATCDFKNHSLPLARIKKIMKADEDVRMIAAEVPVLFARACEMFILELTYRSWAHAEENKRRTLQKNDIAGAITRTDVFDFLVDIVPMEDVKEDVLASISTDGTNESLPYYYVMVAVKSQS